MENKKFFLELYNPTMTYVPSIDPLCSHVICFITYENVQLHTYNEICNTSSVLSKLIARDAFKLKLNKI